MNAPDPRFPRDDAIESAAAEWLVRQGRLRAARLALGGRAGASG